MFIDFRNVKILFENLEYTKFVNCKHNEKKDWKMEIGYLASEGYTQILGTRKFRFIDICILDKRIIRIWK